MTEAKRSPAELRGVFGANLRQLSKRFSSVTELTRQLGVNRTQFNRYLSGESFPRPEVLDQICRFFDVDARILLAPIEEIDPRGAMQNTPFLTGFSAASAVEPHIDDFPGGFYRISKRHREATDKYSLGIIFGFRSTSGTFFRGFTPEHTARQDRRSREFRGYVVKSGSGIALVASHRGTTACSYALLTPMGQATDAFWQGFVMQSISDDDDRVIAKPLALDYLGPGWQSARDAVKTSGIVEIARLPASHRQLHGSRPDQR